MYLFRCAPTLVTFGLILSFSGLIHIPIHLTGALPWEGLVSWRKPILFGLSTGVTLLSLAWVLSGVVLAPWARRLLDFGCASVALWEVAAITALTWAGQPTHVGEEPGWSTLVLQVHLTASALTLAILGLTVVCFRTDFAKGSDEGMRRAARAGMVFLSISCVLGFAVLFHGERQIAAGLRPDVLGVAGVPKFAHGVTIHALQTLTLIVMALRALRIPEKLRLLFLRFSIAGHGALLVFASRQALLGRPRFDVDATGALLFLLAFVALTVIWRERTQAA